MCGIVRNTWVHLRRSNPKHRERGFIHRTRWSCLMGAVIWGGGLSRSQLSGHYCDRVGLDFDCGFLLPSSWPETSLEGGFMGPVRRVWISFRTFDLRIHFRNKAGISNQQRWHSTFSVNVVRTTVGFFVFSLFFRGWDKQFHLVLFAGAQRINQSQQRRRNVDLPKYLCWTASLFHSCGWLLPSLPAGKWCPLR